MLTVAIYFFYFFCYLVAERLLFIDFINKFTTQMTFCALLVPNIMFMKVGKALDVRAQQLLKDLLDDATDKILNTHSKVSPV